VRGKGTKLGEGERKVRLSPENPEKIWNIMFSGILRSGFLPFSGFGIFTFGKRLWHQLREFIIS
jgi:hypothetical protein